MSAYKSNTAYICVLQTARMHVARQLPRPEFFFFAKQRGSGKRNLEDTSLYFTLWGKGIRLEAPPTRIYQTLN